MLIFKYLKIDYIGLVLSLICIFLPLIHSVTHSFFAEVATEIDGEVEYEHDWHYQTCHGHPKEDVEVADNTTSYPTFIKSILRVMIVPNFNLHGIKSQNFFFRIRIHIKGLILRHTSICKTPFCYLNIRNFLCFIRRQMINVWQVNRDA